MMEPTDWNRIFITDFSAERARLGKALKHKKFALPAVALWADARIIIAGMRRL
jgi:hypothetical protein